MDLAIVAVVSGRCESEIEARTRINVTGIEKA